MPRWIAAVLVATFLIAPLLVAFGVPGGLVGRFVLISIGLTLIAALWQLIAGIRRRGELVAKWRNPAIRRWWLGNAALFAAVALVAVLTGSDRYFADGGPSALRYLLLAGAVAVARAMRTFFKLGDEDRPPELPPPPKPFPGIRALFRRSC